MNGTVIDIAGISCNVYPIDLEDSTDKAYLVTFKDNRGKVVELVISYGQITEVNEKNSSSKHEQ